MNTLTESNCEKFGLDWNELISCDATDELTRPGKHDCTLVQKIIEIDKEYFPNADDSVLGFWLTNMFNSSYNYGVQLNEITELVRVEQKEVVVKKWVKI